MHNNHHHHATACSCGCQHDHVKTNQDGSHEHHSACGCGHSHSSGHSHNEHERDDGDSGGECGCGHDHGHGHDHNHVHGQGSCEHEHEHQQHAQAEAAAALALDKIGVPLVFRIEGLDCPDCAAKLAQVVRRQPGVLAADLSYASGELQVFAEEAKIGVSRLKQLIGQMGYGSQLVQTAADAVRLRISGLDCPDCAAKLEQQLARLSGVSRANLSFSTGVLTVAPAAVQAAVLTTVERAGYSVEVLSSEGQEASGESAAEQLISG